ncbi:MAG: hypothetical protein DRJ31_06800 [Candidatus Methanomethylicota archaeon]|uniref:HEPN domain-containing protein n=1 Tax=Thermoproteota archaeon TaxID=2056631 RepID=A0A497EN83_9CREN|nr:MAG: hypothetical protein DRJ31_06800 [Candidatus Verstraetearchaeota archaeon]
MSTIIVTLPEEVLKQLKKKAKSENKTLEELISDAIFKQFDITDPKIKAELHLKLCEKYIREAEESLAKKNYVQASEKAWGAASQIVKAVAARRGVELRSHRDLWEFITKLNKENPDWNLLNMFHIANSLHTNFYENWLTAEAVANGVEIIRTFTEKLKKLTRA